MSWYFNQLNLMKCLFPNRNQLYKIKIKIRINLILTPSQPFWETIQTLKFLCARIKRKRRRRDKARMSRHYPLCLQCRWQGRKCQSESSSKKNSSCEKKKFKFSKRKLISCKNSKLKSKAWRKKMQSCKKTLKQKIIKSLN